MADPFTGWAIVEWRPVIGFEDLYEVSESGLIRRLSTGRVLAPQPRPGGYQGVQLWRNNHPKNVLVHNVVAAAFLGHAPAGHEVNHVHGDKRRNCAGDLEYLTRPENLRHAYRTGLRQVTIAEAAAARRKPRLVIPCACGCGSSIETPDRKGRDRRYINGHNARKAA